MTAGTLALAVVVLAFVVLGAAILATFLPLLHTVSLGLVR